MFKAPRSRSLQSKQAPWIDTFILTGGAIFIAAAIAAVTAGFHNRHLPIHGAAPPASIAGSATSHSGS